jgi:hypothetical protein
LLHRETAGTDGDCTTKRTGRDAGAHGSVLRKPDLVICGGSHLAAAGVAPTQTFPVLVGRLLRGDRRFGPLETVFYSGRPEELRDRPELVRHSPFVLVLIPRNMYGIPLPHHLTLALARLRGQRVTLEDLGARAVRKQPEEPHLALQAGGEEAPEGPGSAPGELRGVVRARRSRAREALRWLAGLALTASCLPALPFLGPRYARQLDRLLASARSHGCRAVVLSTPIPLPASEYPGTAWYQATLARELRRHGGGDVAVADAYRRLRRLGHRSWTLPGDALHLNPEGHRELAEEVVAALERVTAW